MQPDSKETASTEQLAQDAQPNGDQQPQEPAQDAQPNGDQQPQEPAQAATDKPKPKQSELEKQWELFPWLPWKLPNSPFAPTFAFGQCRSFLLKYVYMTPAQATAATLYAVFSYLQHLLPDLRYAPLLHISSQIKRSGKSVLGEALQTVCHRSLFTAGRWTGPALFRTADKYKPTFIIDEADTFMRKGAKGESVDDLRGLVNGSVMKGSAQAFRLIGEKHELTPFSTFCPKVIISIGNLESTTQDRCIRIRLERKPQDAPKANFGEHSRAEASMIRNMFAGWAAENAPKVNDLLHDPNRPLPFPAGMNDRAKDGWRPLLAIATVFGPDVLKDAMQSATDAAGEALDEGEQEWRLDLLRDVLRVFASLGNPKGVKPQDLLEKLIKHPDLLWSDFGGKGLTKKTLTNTLGGFKVRSKSINVGGVERLWGIALADLTKALEPHPQIVAEAQTSPLDSGTLLGAC